MKVTRRSFLKLIPVGAAVIIGSWLLTGHSAIDLASRIENAGSSRTKQALTTTQAAMTEQTTEAPDFPVTWNEDQPINVDAKDYRLTVDGDVSNPLQLTLDELYAMHRLDENQIIGCSEGWTALVAWEGIALTQFLAMAGAPKVFDHVTIKTMLPSGYSVDLSQNDVATSGAMIALKAGRVPLTLEHGYPARLVFPGTLGFEWVKCVNRITCVRQ